MARTEILSWDWKEQIDIKALARLVLEFSDGKAHLVEVDTDDDQFAVCVSDEPLDSAAARAKYDAWQEL